MQVLVMVGPVLATWLGAFDGLPVNPLAPTAAAVLAVALHRVFRDVGSPSLPGPVSDGR